MAGGQLSAGPPLPQLLHLQLELSSEGRRHFLCPLPLISRHSWQAQRRGSKNREGAGPSPLPNPSPVSWRTGLGLGGREHTVPGEGPWGPGTLPVAPLPLGYLPGPQTPQRCSGKRPQCRRQAGGGWGVACPAGVRTACLGGGEAPAGHRGARWAGVQRPSPWPLSLCARVPQPRRRQPRALQDPRLRPSPRTCQRSMRWALTSPMPPRGGTPN